MSVVVLRFMKPDVVRLPQKFKVGDVVVGLVAVDVVNNLALREEPAEMPLHDEAVLVDVAPPVGSGVAVAEFKNVAALLPDATLPVGVADTLLEGRKVCPVLRGTCGPLPVGLVEKGELPYTGA